MDLPHLDYGICRDSLPPGLAARFSASELDQATRDFCSRLRAERASRAKTHGYHLLTTFVSSYDAQAWLGMYPMFLFGAERASTLLGSQRGESLLDVGAGSGDVTLILAPLFRRTLALETSRGMVTRLRQRGLAARRCNLVCDPAPEGRFDTIALLNVLDRTAQPRTLLGACRRVMRDGSCLLLSVPLPFRPHADPGGRTVPPAETLDVAGRSWERQLVSLVERELRPLGFDVLRWTRLPYLSAGDAHQLVYVLDSAVLVCQLRTDAPAEA